MKNLKKLVLLHSNDMHGDFLAEQIDENLVGGVSMLSGFVKKVRAEEPNTLYCIAGDMFRGSVIDSEYQGLSTVEIMNKLSPDVATIGNHEVDYGLSHLLFIEKCANFPIINANLHINMNGKRLFKPYEIIEVDGMKVLFIGILTEDVIAATKTEGIVGSFIDIEDACKEVGKICNAFNAIDIDFTVLLTHIGFEEDKKLAALLDPAWGVDVIIGGHSHTFLDKPEIVNGIPIVQAGTGTDQIGRFDIMVDTDNNCIDSYTWKSIPINNETCPKDSELEEFISGLKEKTDLKYERVICRFEKELEHAVRNRQTELGSLITDTFMKSLGLNLFILGSGSIRKESAGPIFMYKDLVEILPYNDTLYSITVLGIQLKKMLEYTYRDEAFDGGHTEFFQLSQGIEIEYSRSKHSITKFKYDGKDIYDDQQFVIGMRQYHLNNFEICFGMKVEDLNLKAQPRVISTSCQDILNECLDKNNKLDKNWKTRLVITE
mgnify:CR=1 FL=1